MKSEQCFRGTQKLLPEITVGVNNPESRGFDPFLLPFHRLLAPKHPQGELVDPGLQHRPELPVHEARLIIPLVVREDLLDAFQLYKARLLLIRESLMLLARTGGILAALRSGLRGSRRALLARGDFSLRDQTPLLRYIRVVDVPTGDGRKAASEPPAVPVGAGLHGSPDVRLHDHGLSAFGLPEGFAGGRRRQGLHPDALPPGVLVGVFCITHDGRFLSDVLWQTVEPFTHGRMQPVHYDIETGTRSIQ